MRPSLLTSLVLLVLIISEAQGIRLGKVISMFGHQIIHEEEGSKYRRSNNGGNGGSADLCKDGDCTGIYRKLVATKTTSSIISNSSSKNVKSNKENFIIHASPVSKHREEVDVEHHQDDMLDIAEMDYSPARRKPPIHN